MPVVEFEGGGGRSGDDVCLWRVSCVLIRPARHSGFDPHAIIGRYLLPPQGKVHALAQGNLSPRGITLYIEPSSQTRAMILYRASQTRLAGQNATLRQEDEFHCGRESIEIRCSIDTRSAARLYE